MSSHVSVLEDASSSAPFEGPEKLLEIWFAASADDLSASEHAGSSSSSRDLGLRVVPRRVWEDMLDLVRCKVLSVIEGEEVDAYLLSESSMFVWPHKIILKTCGTTTLLLGLDRLLSVAKEYCSLEHVYRCFYSRKAFMFPERQVGPHKKWDDEVKFLDNAFGVGKGSAYVVGKMNGDHWLLYLTSPVDDPSLPERPDHLMQDVLSSSSTNPGPSHSYTTSNGNGNGVSHGKAAKAPSPPDQTLEILMTHLDPTACREFYYDQPSTSTNFPDEVTSDESQQGHLSGSQLSKKLGIDTLLEGSTLDSFLFTPCGYSANIVKDDRYATIHVTPEPDWSYASFECNIDFRTPQEPDQPHGTKVYDSEALHNLIGRVISIFRPNKMSITLFVSVEESAAGVDQGNTPETKTILDPRVAEGYKRTDRILYEFAGYHLLFSTFEKQ